jgi:hypothetical protein
MGAQVSSLASRSGITSYSTAVADKKHEMLTTIFRGLYQNANDIDMKALQNPKLCSTYVFRLQSAIQDAREAEKKAELKFLMVETGGQIDRVAFHPTKRPMQTEVELCREMAIFYLELIFLLYVASLTTNRESSNYFAQPFRRTRKHKQVQRGGGRPLEDFVSFLSSQYSAPNRENMENPDYFSQIVPKFVSSALPVVLFQKPVRDRKVYFWVLQENPKKQVKFSIEFSESSSSESFSMTIYRCRNRNDCDTSIPVLKGDSTITRSSSGQQQFSFYTGPNVLKKVYQINDLGANLTIDDIARILQVAARADPEQLKQNNRFITSMGREEARVTTLTGITGVAEDEVKGSGFAKIAGEFNQFMVKNMPNLYQIRRRMLTPAGNEIQSAGGGAFSTDKIRTIVNTFCKGSNNFLPNGGTMLQRLETYFSQWDNLREANERRYKSFDRDRREVLVPSRIGQLDVFRKRLDNAHAGYTLAISTIVERSVIKFTGLKYIINPDFFNVDKVRLTSVKKLNLIVEEMGEVILKHFIDVENITRDAFDQVFNYMPR